MYSRSETCAAKNGYLLVSTPNLAWFLNRIALALGYQPYFSEPSERINVGKLLRHVEEYTTSGHLRLFTYKAFRQFLNYYNFKILDQEGVPGQHKKGLLKVLDMIFSRKVSLSAIVIFLAQKR